MLSKTPRTCVQHVSRFRRSEQTCWRQKLSGGLNSRPVHLLAPAHLTILGSEAEAPAAQVESPAFSLSLSPTTLCFFCTRVLLLGSFRSPLPQRTASPAKVGPTPVLITFDPAFVSSPLNQPPHSSTMSIPQITLYACTLSPLLRARRALTFLQTPNRPLRRSSSLSCCSSGCPTRSAPSLACLLVQHSVCLVSTTAGSLSWP